MKRRTPLKASRKRLKRSPLRRVSLKRKKQLAVYYSLRRAFLRDNPYCEAFVPGYCSIRATEIHHINGRNGERLTDEEHFLPICTHCHQWIHDNPAKARAVSLLK